MNKINNSMVLTIKYTKVDRLRLWLAVKIIKLGVIVGGWGGVFFEEVMEDDMMKKRDGSIGGG